MVKEIASEVNDKRKKLLGLLTRDDYKDRLTRFGWTYIQTLLEKQGKEVGTDLTQRKKRVIRDILKAYRKTAQNIAKYQWKLFLQTGSVNRKANIKHIQSELSDKSSPSVPLIGSCLYGLRRRISSNLSASRMRRGWGTRHSSAARSRRSFRELQAVRG